MSKPRGYVDSEYLQLLAEMVQRHKQRTYTLMRIEPGHKVLDVGCGPGTDTMLLAQLVGPSGQVVGIDYDGDMVAEANQRAEQAGISGWVKHEHGDAISLRFDSGSFDSVRSERVFEHLTDPKQALSEMIRVTRSGGWIVVLDTDWSTWSTDTPEFEIEQALKRFRVEGFLHNALAGRQLYRLFRQQNLLEISVEMCPTYVTDYAIGRQVGRLDGLECNALEAGVVTKEELDRWHRSLELADAQGVVFGSINQVLVSGRKP